MFRDDITGGKKKASFTCCPLSASETFSRFEIWNYVLENILQILIASWSIHT